MGFLNILRLELRKQRRAFLGLVLAISIGAVLVVVTGIALWDWFLDDLFEAWGYAMLAILPMSAMLFAAAAASGLHQSRETEEALAASPFARVAGAYLISASFIVALGIATVVSVNISNGLFNLTHFYWDALLSLNWASPLSEDWVTLAAGFALFELHFLTFATAYWFRQPFIAAGISFVVAGSHFFLFKAAKILIFYAYRGSFVVDPYALGKAEIHELYFLASSLILFLASAVFGLRTVSIRKETGKRIPFALSTLIGASFLLGVGVSAAYVWMLTRDAESYANRIHLLDYRCEYCVHWSWGGPASADNHFGLRQPLSSGVILQSISGTLIRIRQDGHKETLRRQDLRITPEALGQLLMNRWYLPRLESDTYDYFIQDDGTFWELSGSALSWSKPSQPLTLFRSNNSGYWPSFLDQVGASVYAFGAASDHDARYERLIPSGSAAWVGRDMREVFTKLEGEFNFGICEAGTQTLESSNRQLKWSLPGKCLPWTWEFVPSIAEQGSARGYVLPVEVDPKGLATPVLCQPDGSVTIPWPVRWKSDEIWRDAIPGGGTVFRTSASPYQGFLLVVGPDGQTFPPLNAAQLYKKAGLPKNEEWTPVLSWDRFSVLKLDHQTLWLLLYESDLVEVDLSGGKVMRVTQLCGQESEGCSVYQVPTHEGIYFMKDDRIFLSSWEGQIRQLASTVE
jgi:hypothetical protein